MVDLMTNGTRVSFTKDSELHGDGGVIMSSVTEGEAMLYGVLLDSVEESGGHYILPVKPEEIERAEVETDG